MKNIKFRYLLFFVFLTFIGCSLSSKDGHVHDKDGTIKDKDQNKQQSDIKEVTLNEAQFKASSIELGTVVLKNLNEVIKVNGYTKLPPQNQADVNTFIPGFITRINVNEGQYVQKGQVLAIAESTELTKLQEAFSISNSNLKYLKQEYERQSLLRSENVNSEKNYQKTISDLEMEKAQNRSLQKQLSLVNSYENSGQSLRILAPISGYIAGINIKIGSNTQQELPLFSLIDTKQLHLDLMVYEKDLPLIQTDQQVVFNLPNRDNTEIKGRIFSIGKAFENETKTIAVHASIKDSNVNLIPGMYVNALIHTGQQKVEALPKEAFVKADGREYVFALESKHKDSSGRTEYHFQRIEVKSGVSELDHTQVTFLQAVPANSQLVLNGAYYLQSHLNKSEGGGGDHVH